MSATNSPKQKDRSPPMLKRRNTTVNLRSGGIFKSEVSEKGETNAFAKMNEILAKLKEERKRRSDNKDIDDAATADQVRKEEQGKIEEAKVGASPTRSARGITPPLMEVAPKTITSGIEPWNDKLDAEKRELQQVRLSHVTSIKVAN